jgi:hypothetical protein
MVGPRTQAQQFVPLEEDDEEVTAVGPPALAKTLCIPCGGSGELVAAFFPSVLSRRPCVACRGTGFHNDARPRRPPAPLLKRKTLKKTLPPGCAGSWYAGKKAPFNRVICSVCGARLKRLPGLRAPNHRTGGV